MSKTNGQIAFEAYHAAKHGPHAFEKLWDSLEPAERTAWEAAAEAVTGQVLFEAPIVIGTLVSTLIHDYAVTGEVVAVTPSEPE